MSIVQDQDKSKEQLLAELTAARQRMAQLQAEQANHVRIEEALRHSEEDFRLLVETVNDLVVKVDPAGRFAFVSPSYCALFGRSQQELLGQRFMPLVHEDDQQSTALAMEALFQPPYSAYLEQRAMTVDGWRWLAWSDKAILNAQGEVVAIVGVGRDITDRKRLEEAEKSTRQLLRNVLDTVPVRVFWKDLQGRYLGCNLPFARDAGMNNPEDLIGKDDYALSWAKYAELYRADDRNVVQSGVAKLAYEEPQITPAGETIWLRTSKTPLRDSKGNIFGVLGTYEDITEQKRTQEGLVAAKEQADAANRAKSEFLANMSHEIRTPLNGIMGTLHFLQTTRLNSQQADFLDLAISSTERLTRLLSDILDLSRVEAGKLDIVEEVFDMKSLSDSVAGLFALTARQKGIDLRCTLDTRVPTFLVGDEARLRQILFNLVGNALKFTPKGAVHLEIRRLQESYGDLRILFRVSDTGIGIPEERLKELFQPFSQADITYTRSYEGVGLGLSIVRRLVDLMGGYVNLESRVGQGTQVQVVLPFRTIRPLTAKTERPELVKNSETLRPLRLLLAEDNPVNQLSMQKLLERTGHTVVPAENGREVLDLLAAQDFDCILMDIQMPELNGLEATRIIRESQGLGDKRTIPIIALTAYAMPGEREQFLAAGMSAHVAKPVDMQALKAILQQVVSGGAGA